MGWRSIRLAAAYPEFFQTQLRAILRAGAAGNVKLMFPMITTLEEVRQLKAMLAQTADKLRAQGVPFAEGIETGVMIEVPAAALCIDSLLDEVDFVSIGSNDLLQYIMAADRDNPKVAHLCEPFSPAIFKLLKTVIDACRVRNKPATLCGEMAGRPRCMLALYGMGLTGFSMSPAFVPTIKEVVRSVTRNTARHIAERVLEMRTVEEIRSYLTECVRSLCPKAAIFDSYQ
jgi:phosphoenolpyruvate-protein kinase (PTS system EI component)